MKNNQKTHTEKRRIIDVRCLLVILAATVVIYLLYLAVCSPKRYDLKVGSISHETINATKDVIDEVTTEEKKNSAASAVEPTYHFQDGVTEEVMYDLNQIFSELRTVQQYGQTIMNNDNPELSDDAVAYAQGLMNRLSLTKYQISTLLRTDTQQFEDMVSTVTIAVENQLNTTIREGQVSQSITTIQQIVGFKVDVSLTQNIIPTILRTCVKPNMIIDTDITEEARQRARDSVEPVMYLQGQNIIREGDRVTRSQMQMLSALGLIKNDQFDFSSYCGAAIIVCICSVILVILLTAIAPYVLTDLRKTLVTVIVIILSVALGVLVLKFFNIYLMPVSFAVVLITSILGTKAGISCVVPVSVLMAGLVAGGSSTYLYEMILIMIMGLTSDIFCIIYLRHHPQRVHVIISGVIAAIVNVCIYYAINMMTSSDNSGHIENLLYTVAGGILSGILSIAIQPVFESAFCLATPGKLLELVNPDQPLLRRLMIEAPGTYHHAIIVANLSEAAAKKIGGNALLARAGAYYHDIGKLNRPLYFKENQVGDNPHDRTDPLISAQILTRHTKDGVLLAQKARLPKEIQDIIEEHHGDAPVMYFYHKALQMANGIAVDINDFRYSGPKPRSLESTVVMLADTVEAAVRSMPDPTPQAIRKFIERLIRGKLEDGQLSDSPITLRNIDDISMSFSEVLKGVFHERIEYPNVNIAELTAAQNLNAQSNDENTAVSPNGDVIDEAEKSADNGEGHKNEN